MQGISTFLLQAIMEEPGQAEEQLRQVQGELSRRYRELEVHHCKEQLPKEIIPLKDFQKVLEALQLCIAKLLLSDD